MSLQGDKYTVEELSKGIKARMEAQEQLYAERERHAKTAMQLKIALSKLARQQQPAAPVSDEQITSEMVEAFLNATQGGARNIAKGLAAVLSLLPRSR